MNHFSFKQIIEAVSTNQVRHFQEDFEVSRISIDTRTLKAGDVFLAILGPNYNGHDFIDVAISKGAKGLILSKEVANTSLPTILVEDTVTALKDIAKAYRKQMNAKVIAITGSSGKTTTKDMVATLLKNKYKVSATEKNENNEIGVPLSILNISMDTEIAVIEMGMNRLGEISQSSLIALPDVAIITNIGTAHIGCLGSKENIRKAKLEILEGLHEKGVLIIHGEDDMLKDYPINFPHIEKAYTTSPEGEGHITELRQEREGIYFRYQEKEAGDEIFVPISGKHNVNNAAIAIKCARMLGVSIEEIREAFSYFVGNSLRSEMVSINGIHIIKDYYNANPESMRAALENLRDFPCTGNKIAIIGEIHEMGEFADTVHMEFGDSFREAADYTFFVGGSHQAFQANGNGKSFACENKYDLYHQLSQHHKNIGFKQGDVVLIKGSRGMRFETVFEKLKRIINAKNDAWAMLSPSSSVKLYVDINAMKYNIGEINSFLRRSNDHHVEIMPIIKANAYGCGSETVVNVYKNSKYLAVADSKEAANVKGIFPDKEILILYQPDYHEIEAIVDEGLAVGVCHIEFVRRLNEYAKMTGKVVKIHVEVDTGSNRLGIKLLECEAFIDQVKALDHVVIDGVYMHFICADSDTPEDIEYSNLQTERFKEAVAIFERKCDTLKYRHACSSAAIFTQQEAHFDMVRPGYAIYGYYPSDLLKYYVRLKPVLKLATNILFIKEVEAGEFISYGRTHQTTSKRRIATIAIGYADGYNRLLSNRGSVVVNGQKAPVVGRICMDMTMVDITDVVGTVEIGDEVFLFDNDNVTVDDIANLCGTIGYEIISNIEDKVERIEIF